jgi:hypothetical protein
MICPDCGAELDDFSEGGCLNCFVAEPKRPKPPTRWTMRQMAERRWSKTREPRPE